MIVKGRSPETVSPRVRYGASARPPRRFAHRRRTARSWRLQHPPVAVRKVPETAESSPVHRARRRTSTTSTTARTQSARRRELDTGSAHVHARLTTGAYGHGIAPETMDGSAPHLSLGEHSCRHRWSRAVATASFSSSFHGCFRGAFQGDFTLCIHDVFIVFALLIVSCLRREFKAVIYRV